MTKAETIFRNIRREAMSLVDWSKYDSDKSYGINFDMDGTNGTICQRTVNAVERLVAKYQRDAHEMLNLNVISFDEYRRKLEIAKLMRTAVEKGQRQVDYVKSF